MAVESNWENACRLCSEERSEMLPIFGDEGIQRKMAQKLRACLPVMVYRTDPLPKKICQFCAARLDDAYEFREYCLNVYKGMRVKLLALKHLESVQIFIDAMKNSPDPCQVQLCKERVRAPPPLVPLSSSLPVEDSARVDVSETETGPSNNCDEPLPELPCEVQIKEEPSSDTMPSADIESNDLALPFAGGTFDELVHESDGVPVSNARSGENSGNNFETRWEEKRTSILEQVLTGSLTMNDRKELEPKARPTSKWWCAPCNNYYRTREGLTKHMRHYCPREYTCKKCNSIFHTVEDLAKHEGSSHLKITLDFDEPVKECHQCDREFVCWEMLKHHRLRDHRASSIETGVNTWCPLCNRFFPSTEQYDSHKLLHRASAPSTLPVQPVKAVPQLPFVEIPEDIARKDHFVECVKSLTCPTCGKVCTQQSALSNHMRTHEPKKHKCEICGRSFGLFIRLAAHRLSEHNQQPVMTPVMASVEQEEALNAEREAREAREARSRGGRSRTYSEAMEEDDLLIDNEPPAKRNALSNPNSSRNVARCGICLQWFSDHTTMLTHLQTHSDSYVYKSFSCRVCKKTFKEKWQLLRHEVSHKRANATTHTCGTCHKTFTDKILLKAHEATHVVDKTYHCSKCNKIFFKEFSLMTHQCTGKPIFNKRGVPTKALRKSPPPLNSCKRYKCSKCDATFSNSQSRNSHMRIHSETHSMIQVRKHELMESDIDSMPKLTPETCPGTSTTVVEPKIEISEESPPTPIKRTLIRTAGGYRCGVCQSPFVLRELAVAHLRSAHPVMPYQCPYCKKRFTTQYTFTHHIKTDHPDESEK